MFLDHFVRAQKRLCQRGLNATIVMGMPLSRHDLQTVDGATDFPMPSDLREFYLELGDGFSFVPDEDDEVGLVGWEPMRLADHKIWNIGFSRAVEENAAAALSESSSPALLKQEIERRKLWMPFYGFVGGGSVLCLDLSLTPSPVRFHEAVVWMDLPHRWDFSLAASFTDFVEQWSRHDFLTPAGEWTSYCKERSGRFDWSPEHFPSLDHL